MAWDISYKHGEKSGFRSLRTRDDALAFCWDMILQGYEILSVTNDDKKSTETLSLDQVQQCAARMRVGR